MISIRLATSYIIDHKLKYQIVIVSIFYHICQQGLLFYATNPHEKIKLLKSNSSSACHMIKPCR